MFQNRTAGDWWNGVLMGQISFWPPKHQCQITEGNAKHKLVAWPNPFFIHRRTPDSRCIAPFMAVLRRQYCIVSDLMKDYSII